MYMNEMNPFEILRQISGGYCLSRSLHVLAELNVADALDETPQSAAELAKSRPMQMRSFGFYALPLPMAYLNSTARLPPFSCIANAA
jgi:hypothetical protein